MKTNYGFLGIYKRYGGFVVTFILIILLYNAYNKNQSIDSISLALTVLSFMISVIYLWIHPHVEIYDKGLRVTRFLFVAGNIEWRRMILYQKREKTNHKRENTYTKKGKHSPKRGQHFYQEANLSYIL